MNKYELHLGDCLEVMKSIPDGSVDMILCDLPYGTTACKWDTVIPFEPLWAQYRRIAKRNSAIVLTASQPFTSALTMSNIKAFRYSWVWEKGKATGHLNAKKMPLKKHEDILVFCFGSTPYHAQGLISVKRKNSRPSQGVTKGEMYGKQRNDYGFSSEANYPKSVIFFLVSINQYTQPKNQSPLWNTWCAPTPTKATPFSITAWAAEPPALRA